ncbi:CLUMA_CG011102, isoform A [Clunio marinus]|uniref:CLUMA_CG011102, isoform A n=1 Tax=Clunio marinus TaxID=568069 RepID=A0A1J1ID95_9DIPT|nr:CLUMA_CG011102, isoform A [Clunio marinus]
MKRSPKESELPEFYHAGLLEKFVQILLNKKLIVDNSIPVREDIGSQYLNLDENGKRKSHVVITLEGSGAEKQDFKFNLIQLNSLVLSE